MIFDGKFLMEHKTGLQIYYQEAHRVVSAALSVMYFFFLSLVKVSSNVRAPHYFVSVEMRYVW